MTRRNDRVDRSALLKIGVGQLGCISRQRPCGKRLGAYAKHTETDGAVSETEGDITAGWSARKRCRRGPAEIVAWRRKRATGRKVDNLDAPRAVNAHGNGAIFIDHLHEDLLRMRDGQCMVVLGFTAHEQGHDDLEQIGHDAEHGDDDEDPANADRPIRGSVGDQHRTAGLAVPPRGGEIGCFRWHLHQC